MRRFEKPLVFVACLLPLAMLAWAGFEGRLGANPIETITHTTGDWTLRFLLITLAVTPLRRLSRWNRVIAFRRMLGLFAFFYGTLHLLTYVWLDKFFAWQDMLHDIAKRPIITAGVSALALMVPLALTSTAAAIRRLGGRRWRALHRLIYASASLGVLHYWWLVKADVTRPATYACILILLLLVRAWFAAERALQRSTVALRAQLPVERQ